MVISSDLRKEDRLLLYCIRDFLGEIGNLDLKELIQDDIDWSYLMIASENQRILPLIYLSLNNNCSGAIPKDVATCLQNKFRKNSLYNLSSTKELLQLLYAFRYDGIATIPFKGPIMALDIYGDLSRRQFLDLDILIHLEDMHKASRLLQRMGYKPKFLWESRLNERQLTAFFKSDHHIRYENDDRGITVELHWSIYPPIYKIPSIDIKDLWNRAEINNVLGKEVLALSTEDLLLYLCIHGAKHGWQRLSWICDIAMLIKTKKVDLQEVLKRSEEAGSKRLFLLGLFLANELLSVRLSFDILEEVRADPMIPMLAETAKSNLFSIEGSTMNSSRNLLKLADSTLFYLKAADRYQDRLKIFFLREICPDVTDYEFIRLPNSLYPLYYIVKPIRLLLGRIYAFIWLRVITRQAKQIPGQK